MSWRESIAARIYAHAHVYEERGDETSQGVAESIRRYAEWIDPGHPRWLLWEIPVLIALLLAVLWANGIF